MQRPMPSVCWICIDSCVMNSTYRRTFCNLSGDENPLRRVTRNRKPIETNLRFRSIRSDACNSNSFITLSHCFFFSFLFFSQSSNDLKSTIRSILLAFFSSARTREPSLPSKHVVTHNIEEKTCFGFFSNHTSRSINSGS